MRYIKGTVAVAVLVVMVVFAMQNLQMIEVSFLSWSMSVPKVLVIGATYVLGMVTGAWLFDFLRLLFKRNASTEEK